MVENTSETNGSSVLDLPFPHSVLCSPCPKQAANENTGCSSRTLCLSVAHLILPKDREDVTNLQSQNRNKAVLGKSTQIVLASSIES